MRRFIDENDNTWTEAELKAFFFSLIESGQADDASKELQDFNYWLACSLDRNGSLTEI